MRRVNRYPLIVVVLLMAALACNIQISQQTPQDPNAAYTAAAQTVAAHLTDAAQVQATPTTIVVQPTASPIPNVPTPTNPVPTIPPPTNPPPATQECDKAAFVADVTIPDGTVLPKDQAFTKTWRLKNIGTCSWTTSYAVVFFSGEAMSGPAAQALTGNINPGQTVEISVNMKTPSHNGNYTGYWKLRNASGATFSQFYVQIAVQGGGSGVQFASSSAIPGESGLVRSDGIVVANDLRVGDNNANQTLEVFLSFDISGIPFGSNILQVVVDFSGASLQAGSPFSISDGCLRGYADNYGALNAPDFYPGDPLGAIMRWCSWGELGSASANADVASALQAAVGSPRFQVRIQFRAPTTNSNGAADQILLYNPHLIIKYDAP
jgi:hypothetical protein